MLIRVGPYRYRVELVNGYVEHEQTLWLAVTDHQRHLIRVSDRVADEDRLRVMLSELMQAWWNAYDSAETSETTVIDAMVSGMVDLLDQLAPRLSGKAMPAGVDQIIEALATTSPKAEPTTTGRANALSEQASPLRPNLRLWREEAADSSEKNDRCARLPT